MVDAAARSVSRMKRSRAISPLWSAWRNSAGVVIDSVRMRCSSAARRAGRRGACALF
jgi:hypothetical protein